ncbi:hypothetical protein RRG08_064522 [Elysia crispata]|uniref:Uncharacterized protein n=1 Tax=Elysia crispata TaxID=231223 RepID=A0AAE0XYZ6_9GAST|nr:hypothetical protein RRG08_064522 [Elysia crispata]
MAVKISRHIWPGRANQMTAGMLLISSDYRSFSQLDSATTQGKDAGQRGFCLAPVPKTQLISYLEQM